MASLGIQIRAYDEALDKEKVDEVEKMCEAGPSGKVSLFTDLLGDPLCRVRQYPDFHMLVAENLQNKEIVGFIRAGVKEVSCGVCDEHGKTIFVSAAYILGLRVSPKCRRLGVGTQLVKKMEDWCRSKGAQYVYMATETDNEASVSLFTHKLGYTKFRNPAILIQPVRVRRRRRSMRHVHITPLTPSAAAHLYATSSSTSAAPEFLPADLATSVLKSRLHRGTYLATCPSSASWAALSLWKCNDIYRLQMKGAAFHMRLAAAASRAAASALCCFSVPSVPDLFQRPFGLQLIYGVVHHGPRGADLVRHLAWHAHDLALQDGCSLVATEVAGCDPVRRWIPRWTDDEDLWCIKRLGGTSVSDSSSDFDWSKSPPPPSLFLDPRDF